MYSQQSRSRALLLRINLESDLRVDSVLRDPVVVDHGLEVLDINRFYTVKAFRSVIDGDLRGVFPAIVGLGQYLDYFVRAHDHSLIRFIDYCLKISS